jgi:Fic family protein
MDELFDFISNEDSPKYDLLRAAIAHHRFVWIHPFGNGNGRTVRLLTYAMLVKTGFNVNIGRILNPTAVFCSNRNDYYNNLSKADSGTEQGVLAWTEYVLKGLKEEIEKIDKLADYSFLRNEILSPAIAYSLQRK